ncbi:class I SAM-dependent rRNA methyltransferase [Candidatus Gracilibacteria bacterium]|nr:class I SAM-dependent rRNA methyltransferase [Candidatus Gracilibacteria bacterium]
MSDLPKIILKPKKDMPVVSGHPWIFSNGISKCEAKNIGEIVEVFSDGGEYVGTGCFNPNGSISVRILSRNRGEAFDSDFFEKRFRELDELKKKIIPENTNGYRLCYADSDGLPGLIVDKYDNVFVFQIHTAGMDNFREEIISALKNAFKPSAIVERSDVEIRRQEGLKVLGAVIHFGKTDNEIIFEENGIKFYVDVIGGQKTGFFLDQRDARKKLFELSKNKKVLNLFCYTGAFSLYAAKGGAIKVTSVDISKTATEYTKKNFELNKIDAGEIVTADVFDFLSTEKIKNGDFDIIVCDPPAFAKSGGNVQKALKAYMDLNRKCLALLKKDGILFSSSCSGRVSLDDFRNTLKIAAGGAKKDVRVLSTISQATDHTDKLSFPEGRYLKTLVLQVL